MYKTMRDRKIENGFPLHSTTEKRTITLNCMVADLERKVELILHVMYNFQVIHNGNICYKTLLLRKFLRHKFRATGTVFREKP